MNEPKYDDMINLARDFVKGEITEAVREDDRFPYAPFRESLYKKAEEVGFLSLLLPEEAGGVGETVGALAEVLYEISKTDASVAAVILCQAFAHRLLVGAGQESLAKDAGLIAVTLYDDPVDLPAGVIASEIDGSYRLEGMLDYMVLAPVARSYLVPALLNGKTALFLVGGEVGVVGGEVGVKMDEPLQPLGLRACPVADLRLEEVEDVLPVAKEGAQGIYLEAVRDMRGAVAAVSAGIIAGCFEEARAYAPERYQGYRQIIEHQQVRAELGRIAVEMMVARELFRSICRRDASGVGGPVEAAVQVAAGESAVEASILGVQILGGNGYMEDYGQEKRMRDAKQVQGIFGMKDLVLQDITEALAAG
jgi:alkylation response protein AidB-like acyl-CoA dehydrogenase